MKKEALPRNKNLNQRAREMRNIATPEEKKLWFEYLKDYPVQFNRQRIVGNYITDFYCHRAKLAVELDGAQHFEEESLEYDNIRTEYMNACGIEVIRFTNYDIRKNLDAVCRKIDNAIKTRMKALSKAPLERSCRPQATED